MSDVTHCPHVLNSHDNQTSLFSHIKYEQFLNFSLFEGISNNQGNIFQGTEILLRTNFCSNDLFLSCILENHTI